MLEILILYLQATFKNSFPLIKDIEGLAEQVQQGNISFPSLYCTNDEYQPISGDENFLYFRQLGAATESESDEESVSGCDEYVTRTYPMVAIAYVPKNIFNTDNAFVDSKIAGNIANILRVANYGTLTASMKADEIHTEVKRISTDRYEVWDQEFKGIDMAARFDHVLCAVEFDLVVSATERCLQNFDCNDETVTVEGDTIVVEISDPDAWHKAGDFLSEIKKLGSLNNQDWRLIHTSQTIVTVQSAGIVVTGSIDYTSGAIQSLNGLIDKVQTFAIGSSGTDFNLVSAAGVHTFNIPDAGVGIRGGLVNNAAQTFAGAKTISDIFTINDNVVFPNKVYFTLAGERFLHTTGGTGGGDIHENLFLGYEAGKAFDATSIRYANTAVGYGALSTLDGSTSGAATSTSNTALGYNAGLGLVNGTGNTFVGTAAAGVAGPSILSNTAVGWHAMRTIKGSDCVAIGASAMDRALVSNGSIAIGSSALNQNTATTQDNISIGRESMQNGTNVGSFNVAVGWIALREKNSSAAGLVAVGAESLRRCTTALRVTAVGYQTLAFNLTGADQTAIGYNALMNATGANNTALGSQAGSLTTSGAGTIMIGNNVQPTGATVSNELNIGNALYGVNLYNLATSRFGMGVITPAASAKLDITSTTLGFLPPRMTTAQKNAISSPTAGLIVYDTSLNKLCVYTTAWETITSV